MNSVIVIFPYPKTSVSPSGHSSENILISAIPLDDPFIQEIVEDLASLLAQYAACMGRAGIVVGPPNYDDEIRKELARELCALIFRTSGSFEHLGPLVICSVRSPLKIQCQLELQKGFESTVELQASVSFLDLPFRGEVTKAIQKKYNWDQLPQQIQDGFKKSGGTTAFFSIAKPDDE